MTVKKSRIVVIGGGTGAFTVLSGLKKYPVELTAVVSMADDGGSTGVLREEFGVLPPGDVRRVLVALADADRRLLSDLFSYRFEKGGLKGHAFGNIMLTALERLTGSFEDAVHEAGRLLGVSGAVLPVTLDNVRLSAELENGTVVCGETNIDIPQHDGRLKIKKVWLEPAARLNPRVKQAILGADLIVIGPGDLYTSIVPNLVVRGMREALGRSAGTKVYVVNVMTKWGETMGFSADDFIRAVERYVGRGVVRYALINTTRPSRTRLRQYEKESAEFVEQGAFASRSVPLTGDLLRRRGFVRHDPELLARVLLSLI